MDDDLPALRAKLRALSGAERCELALASGVSASAIKKIALSQTKDPGHLTVRALQAALRQREAAAA